MHEARRTSVDRQPGEGLGTPCAPGRAHGCHQCECREQRDCRQRDGVLTAPRRGFKEERRSRGRGETRRRGQQGNKCLYHRSSAAARLRWSRAPGHMSTRGPGMSLPCSRRLCSEQPHHVCSGCGSRSDTPRPATTWNRGPSTRLGSVGSSVRPRSTHPDRELCTHHWATSSDF